MENKSACFFRPLSFAVRHEPQYCLFLQHSSKDPYILFFLLHWHIYIQCFPVWGSHSQKLQTWLFVILLHHQCLKLYSISNEYGALVEWYWPECYSTPRKTHCSVTLSTTNLKCMDLATDLAPNHLHHGTAMKPVCFQLTTKMTAI